MFSGVGGFELGIERATDNQRGELGEGTRSTQCVQPSRDSSDSEGDAWQGDKGDSWECIGFSEIDKYAIQTYRKHFPNHKAYGDARKINPKELPNFDMLCGGFPCQSFSIAGKRLGFEDTRGTLFFDIARIAKEKIPMILL